jgi:hypothetical protein
MGGTLKTERFDPARAPDPTSGSKPGPGSRWGRASTVAGVALLSLSLLAGCAAANGTSEETSGAKLELLRADSPLRAPTWVPKEGVLLAISEDGRELVRLDPGAGTRLGKGPGRLAVVRSKSLGDAGENLAPNPRKLEDIYVPQPTLNRLTLVDVDTLRAKGSLEAGKAREWAAVHPGSKSLFYLSEDGSTVTGVSLDEGRRTFSVRAEGSKDAFLEVPEKGIEPAFYVVDPGGVEFFSGFPPERQVGKRIGVEEEAFTLDDDAAERVYVGEPSGQVDLIEGDPQDQLEGRLLVEKKVDLGEPAEYLESRIAEELLVYAATESKVVAIRYDTMQIVGSVDFRRPLKQKSLKEAKVSGMTVGEKRVYLTLEGEPYSLSVKKPS